MALDVLDETDAREVLALRLGPNQIAAEPEAVAGVLASCGGSPLALGVVAGRAATHPDFPIAVWAAELRNAATRLDALDSGDPTASVTAVLSWSYAALDLEQAEVFGLLGLAPGPDISLLAAANLTALPLDRLSSSLQALERVSLLQQPTSGRYWMHDLIRLYASNQAQRDQVDGDRDTALRRLVDFYTHTAHVADRILFPHRPLVEIGNPAPGCRPMAPKDGTSAWAWLETEHQCLMAAQRLAIAQSWHLAVWNLAWTMDTFYRRRGYVHDALVAWEAGLAASQHVGGLEIQALAHRGLGYACVPVGRHDDAVEHLNRAVALAESAGNLAIQAHAHRALAQSWGTEGDYDRALKHAVQAIELARALDNPVLEARALNNAGWYSAELSHYGQARTYCETALILCRQHNHREGEAFTLHSLGYIAHSTGRHTEAVEYYQQAISILRRLGHNYNEADVLDRLAQTLQAVGDHLQAHDIWLQAMALYLAQHRTTDADRVQRRLAALKPQSDSI